MFLRLALLTLPLVADVRLPAVFSTGMVLQRDHPNAIWGRADEGESVTVTFRDRQYRTTADALGRWQIALNPTGAGGPFTLQVAGKNTIVLNDVLVGEVWLASGQSNMGMAVRACNNAEQEIAASANPQIRFFKVPNTSAPTPAFDVKGEWSEASPKSTGGYSAAAYYFARHLNEKLKVPVAILQSAWGGTPAEAWLRASALAADPGLLHVHQHWAEVLEAYPNASLQHNRAVAQWEANGKKGARPAEPRGPGHQHNPSVLWNGMIHPLVPYGIRGAIWYQGEANASVARAAYYQRLMTALITDWRRAFGQGDFPFLYVQLANYARPGTNDGWPMLREAQLKTLDLVNTGMAVAIDIGEAQDIHPKNKQDVGLRLALQARAIAYGEKLVHQGPMYKQLTREGASIRVWFDSWLSSKGPLEGFEIAGANGKFAAATEIRIDGQSVVLSNPEIKEPVQVRYGWADDPKATLTNVEGLPASPFRTRN
jgi:sialate O-acetylesterase